jgi:hypothetical protein
MENGSSKRRVGRPKARPQIGPLVLQGSQAFVRLDVDVVDSTAEELTEYVRWVELSSSIATSDAKSKTVDFALRDLFKHDRLWREHQKNGDRHEARPESATPTAAVTSSPALPPPASPARPIPAPTLPPGNRPGRPDA